MGDEGRARKTRPWRTEEERKKKMVALEEKKKMRVKERFCSVERIKRKENGL